MTFLWSTDKQNFELSTNTIQIFHGGQTVRPCPQPLFHFHSTPLISQRSIFSCMTCRRTVWKLLVWWDGALLGCCGLELWIRAEEPPQFQIRMPPLSRLRTAASWLKPGLRSLFSPRRRQLPKRLGAPLLRESHELTAGLNYKVAFLQRSAVASVKLSLWSASLYVLFLLNSTANPDHANSKGESVCLFFLFFRVINVSRWLWFHLIVWGRGL